MSRGCNWIEFERQAKIASLFLFTLFIYLVGFELVHGRLYIGETQAIAILRKDGSLLRCVEGYRCAVPQEVRR